MATVNDKFKVKHGLQVDNASNNAIITADNTNIEFFRHTKIIGTDATSTPLVLLSHPSQVANLQEWIAQDLSVLAHMDPEGHLFTEKITTQSDVVIGGNLTVNGTTTTIHSIIATVTDPVLLLGGENPPTEFDGKDRGIEFRWHDGVSAQAGFFGFHHETGRFTFIPEATNTGEIFSGDLGDVEVKGLYLLDKITSSSESFDLLNTSVETINFGGAATNIQIGSTSGTTNINNDLDVDGDINVDGGDFTVTSAAFNFANTTVETINFGGAATNIQIGSSTGTTNVNNDLDVDGDVNIDGGDLTVTSATFNLANTNATTVNFAGAATDIQIGSVTGTTNVNNNLDVDGDLNVDGADFTTSAATFNLLNNTATTINFGGAATDIQIGSSTGTTNINNSLDVDGDINVDGGDITVTSATFNLANANATTINFAGQATDINIGASTGTTTFNHNVDVEGDLKVDGGDILTSKTAINVVNTNATTVNFAGDATDIQIGSSTGITNVNNDLDVDGDVNVDGGVLSSNLTNFNLLKENVQYLDFALAAIDLKMGATTGTTTVRNNLDVNEDLTVKGGDIKVTTTQVNVVNTTATTVNFAGAATTLNIGANTGTTTINNDVVIKDNLTIEGTTTNFNPPTTGTAPFTVGVNAYNVLVAGLNADLLDGETKTWYQARENHTGTQPSTTISDWSEAVQDTVAPMFVHSQNTGITATYNDLTGRVILAVTGGGGGGGGGDFSLSYWMGV